MSNFEFGSSIIHELPESTQSFEKMLDEIVDDATKMDTYSLDSESFDPNPGDHDQSIGKNNQIDKNIANDNFVMKFLPESAEMINSSLLSKTEIDKGQCEINWENDNSDRYSSAQNSLCTECRHESTPNNFQASSNTPCQTPGMNRNVDIKDESDQYNKDRFLQKRSHSVVTEKINPETPTGQGHSLKRFKSESSISTVKIAGICNCDPINCGISSQNLTDISQTIEPFATNCGSPYFQPATKHVDNVSKHPAEPGRTFSQPSDDGKRLPDVSTPHQVHSEIFMYTEGTGNNPIENTVQVTGGVLSKRSIAIAHIDKDSNSRNKVPPLRSQDLDKADSDSRNTTFSRSTIEEIYYIDDINDAKTTEYIKEIQEIHCLKRNSSTFNESTIEETNYVDTADDIEIPQYRVVGGNSMKSKITHAVIQEKGIDVGLQLLMHSLPDEMIIGENNNPVHSGCDQNFGRARADDNLESVIAIEMGSKRVETTNIKTGINIVPVYRTDNAMVDVNSAKDPESRNKILDESVLEITIDSDTDRSARQDSIVRRREIHSTKVVDNSKPNFTNPKNNRKDEKEKKNKPIDLSILNTNKSSVEYSTPLNDVSAENVEKTISPDYFATQFLTAAQLEKIDVQLNELETKTADSPKNITSIKDANTASRDDENTRDDSSLEFLSDSQLQRIEEEAYIKAKKPKKSINSNIPKAKSIVKDQDVFYRPEQPNMITEKITNDLVLPNWVVNPAPEPNYEKIKQAIRMRREYIRKMLQEIQRLSSIVSEVKSVFHAEQQQRNLEVAPKRDSGIQGSLIIQHVENNTNNRSVDSGTFCGTQINSNRRSNIATKVLPNKDIFYAPETSRSKNNVLADVALASGDKAEGNTNCLEKDSRASGEFYAPQSNESKYDASPIFNQPKNVEFSRNEVCHSNTQFPVSSIFESLKRDLNGDRTYDSEVSRVGYKSRENKGGIGSRESDNRAILRQEGKFVSRINAGSRNEYELPKIRSSVTLCGNEKTILNVNRADPIKNDTIFYFPDKPSSSSSNYKVLPCVQNDVAFPTVDYAKRKSTPVEMGEQRLLNSGNIFAPHAIGNDDGIFYKGNK